MRPTEATTKTPENPLPELRQNVDESGSIQTL